MRQIVYFCAFALAGACSTLAQGDPDNDKLLTTFQNPVGNLISVPFQNNVNFPIGPYSRVQDVLNIQPVVPISLSEDWLLISRWITPVVYQPNILNPSGGANGLGDINPSFFLSPARPGTVIWGIWSDFPAAYGHRPHSRPRQVGNGALDCDLAPAGALDDRLPIQ